jgi:membrane-bound lytic murein transglycosylase D
VTSPVGAKGLWQFMKPTGLQYGLEINDEIDERYNAEKATHAACRLLKDNHKQFGSWLYASAAYNEGSPRLSREISEQKAKDIFDLNMNEETHRYVFRLGAIKEIMLHPEEYDFVIPSNHMYQPFPETYDVQVSDATNWADFARKYNLSFRMLKVYNPWIITPNFTNKLKKTYSVKIPK